MIPLLHTKDPNALKEGIFIRNITIMSKIAVIQTGGKQYRVEENDVLAIEKLPEAKGDTITFDQVLLVADADGNDVKVGEPTVSGAKVEATILDQYKDKKIRVVKYKAKVRYSKSYGHRQQKTKVKITKIAA